ncbi:sugar porter family MFS transporter [Gordonia sp. X0973]|uniref:sugar porter family MFS transporter n=1 Tax=Gordonia sp. X0973 TaxID=2742602 RepID=UPI000F520F9D|nr:sugar porter family MFS transporter [Gordonia sp. X0973]QKT05797.1 sugar porter family MFS transporter [Gordonia sp. X0973]
MKRAGLLVAVAAASMGIVYGYDQSNIGAAMEYVGSEFTLDDNGKQWLYTVAVVGSIIGALVAGPLANLIGRKKSMIAVAVGYGLFAVLSGIAPSFTVLAGVRFLLGVTVGVSLVVVPVFVAESAPARSRGAMLVAYQMTTIIGIIAGFLIGYFLAGHAAWRWMLGLAVIPAVLVLILLTRLPDTPRWYLSRGREADARAALTAIDPDADVDGEIAEMRAALAAESGGHLVEMLRRPWVRATAFVLGLGFLIQITGINAVAVYGPRLFEEMGYSDDFGKLLLPALVQVYGLIAVILALRWVDRIGRRPLLLGGIFAMIVATGILICVYGPLADDVAARQMWGFAGLAVFTMGFSFGFGALVWVYAGESFPARLRSYGSSAMLTSDLVANVIVAQFTLTLINSRLGGAGTFAIFGGFAVIAFLFVARLAPETKGRTLEDIQQYWTDGAKWARKS